MTNTSEPAEVTLNMQYIRDMSLEVPHAPEIFSKLNSQPKLNVDLNIDVNKLNENNFEVTLNLRIDADINEEKLLFSNFAYAAALYSSTPEENLNLSYSSKSPSFCSRTPGRLYLPT